MVDSHCHLTHPRLREETEAVLARAAASGVSVCVTIGTGVEDAIAARETARAHPGGVFVTAGLDPFSSHAAGPRFDEALGALDELLRSGDFVALGEVGLDYHYDLDPRAVQRRRLERQLALARDLDLPVVIHVRDAHDDRVSVLADHRGVPGVIHSFTGGPGEAERYLALGLCLAFNGVLTFPRAAEVRDAAARVPADALLVETDAPFLAPVPHRGRRCEPAFVVATAQALAAVRGVETEEIARITDRNARSLFRLPLVQPT
jgi:TatD DNase family protein